MGIHSNGMDEYDNYVILLYQPPPPTTTVVLEMLKNHSILSSMLSFNPNVALVKLDGNPLSY